MKIKNSQAELADNDSATAIRSLGQYPTPVWVAEALVSRHFASLDHNDLALEPSCGPGAFLGAIPDHVPAVGIDIDPLMVAQARRNTGREVILGDFRTVDLDLQPTVILGNPPFDLKLIDGFLDRAHQLLPENGRVGLVLPAYAFQTAARVSGYADRWSLFQEMIPRNIYPGLSLPLVFAVFSKDRRRTMIGFALYRETAAVQQLAKPYRELLAARGGPVWRQVIRLALERLGGEADLQDIYREIEANRPTTTPFWREQIRKVIRRPDTGCRVIARGRYGLAAAANDRQMAMAI